MTPLYLERRISILEANSFRFYERHALGALGAGVPRGYKAIWQDREKLVVAKLADNLQADPTQADLIALLMQPQTTKMEDIFVEIHIDALEGIDGRDISQVTLQEPNREKDGDDRWENVKILCQKRNIRVEGVASRAG